MAVIEQVMTVRNKIAAFVVASTPPEEEKPAQAKMVVTARGCVM